ncbi:helix-turn-helix transcriptional regulator [Streptomyces luteolifulvus]|jgi:LuxR family maltose regulon positive regulatory protein|uniref:Helix-turn-helix transcriptional regulator n=1 Tax=Streptomyces luteolifulvus TaxID=2615112 RepID=A0A6H9V1M4_9ACTN|nr:LuxR C-terminal-related transcriptional regulator [Streptomyces luteolifulvus]KAB1148198.1 helix-turn-helix transcriptional regulator [Streptomyces luteolifulvus]
MAGLDDNGPRSKGPEADPQGDPFLRTRFAVPTRPATFLRRNRLVRHLDQALRTPLTMVNGAAGAGKTLLVADWAARREPVAWLTTDAGIQGPGMFWAYLLQALRVSGLPLSEGVGSPAEAGRVDRTLLTRLATDLSTRDRPVIVVLDEFDRVTDPEIAEQLEFVLHHTGRGMRLILVTRTEPLLPLHRYRAVGDMTEIRDAELAFTPEEAAALMERHGLHLPVPAARTLVERTRGWAAGLRLCALAAQESPDPATYLKEFEADRTTVADFLLAEVLKRQTPETQDLLLRVSVLERFSPELANALTERADAEPILAGLHRENAFVEHLGHGWYRLHPLFREILQAHLRVRSPGLEPELHRRAAAWLRRSGSLAETLGHGAAAGDWEFTAAALVDDLAIGQLFTGLRSDDLAELFSRMGPEATSPATDLVRAARELSRSDLDRGLTHLQHAKQSLAGEERAAGDTPGLAAARLSCALLEALAARLAGSPEQAERAAAEAERLREKVPAHLLDKHPELTALLLVHLGSARLWAGRFDDARTALTAVADCSGGASTALPREDSLGRLALIDYLNGWLDRAERKARAAIAETERFGLSQPSGSGVGRLVLAAVAVDRNELDQAQALLDVAADDPAMRDPVTEAGRAIATARLLLARGDTRAALQAVEPDLGADVVSPWAQGHTALVASAAHLAEGRPETAVELLDAVSEGQVACAVEAARARLAAGRPAEAIDLLDRVHPDGRSGPAVTVRAALVRAQAADRAGDAVTSRRLVAQALHEARRERLRRPFVEAGPWIRPFLGMAPLRGLAAGWLTPGPPSHGAAPRPADQPPPVVEELSERERDVLQRLAQMMSTEEIAADLYVSVNTVKTHLKSVYRKLAVNRRNDAVRRARELRLL